jgi:hypothetical protein
VAINEVFAQQPKHGMWRKGKTQPMVLPLTTLSFAILVANKVIHQQITVRKNTQAHKSTSTFSDKKFEDTTINTVMAMTIKSMAPK